MLLMPLLLTATVAVTSCFSAAAVLPALPAVHGLCAPPGYPHLQNELGAATSVFKTSPKDLISIRVLLFPSLLLFVLPNEVREGRTWAPGGPSAALPLLASRGRAQGRSGPAAGRGPL